MPSVLLFDLDGTLMDTAPEIADALGDTLARLGLPPVDEARVRGWIGDGARALLGKALCDAGVLSTPSPAAPHPAGNTAADAAGAARRDLTAGRGGDAALLAQAWRGFAVDYALRCGSRSRLFPGAAALLARCRERGLRLAVLTNKEGRFAHQLLVRHGIAEAFDLVVAGDSLPVRKPDPAVVHHALQAFDAEPDQALLIGDSVTDVRTARAAGIGVWLVRHGYPGGEPAGADAPDRWLDHFDAVEPEACARVAIA
ncbi:MAG: hypothetical protein RL223_370 [Pseudomonadota bacterium]|jgi:phosphoglycolate phosphatase